MFARALWLACVVPSACGAWRWSAATRRHRASIPRSEIAACGRAADGAAGTGRRPAVGGGRRVRLASNKGPANTRAAERVRRRRRAVRARRVRAVVLSASTGRSSGRRCSHEPIAPSIRRPARAVELSADAVGSDHGAAVLRPRRDRPEATSTLLQALPFRRPPSDGASLQFTTANGPSATERLRTRCRLDAGLCRRTTCCTLSGRRAVGVESTRDRFTGVSRPSRARNRLRARGLRRPHALGRDGRFGGLFRLDLGSTLSSPIVRTRARCVRSSRRAPVRLVARGTRPLAEPGASPASRWTRRPPYVADARAFCAWTARPVVWQAAVGGRDAIVDGAGTVYSTATGSIAAIDASGVFKWQFSAVDPTNPSTAQVTPGLRAIGGDGTLYVLFGGRVHAIGGGGRCEGKPATATPRFRARSTDATWQRLRSEPKCVSPGAGTTRAEESAELCTSGQETTVERARRNACSRGAACRAGRVPRVRKYSARSVVAKSAHEARHTRATALLGPPRRRSSGPRHRVVLVRDAASGNL